MYFVFTPHPRCPSYVIRYEILDDPANLVTVDKKTGEVKTVKQIDRESLFLNGTDVYTFLIGVIDNGKRKQHGKICHKPRNLIIGQAHFGYVF